MPTFRNHVSVPSSEAGSKLCLLSLLPASEDGTDTWFRNVGILYIDAREILKRTYTIFKSRRKLEIYNLFHTFILSFPNGWGVVKQFGLEADPSPPSITIAWI